MNILISNDDGYGWTGLDTLVETVAALSPEANIVIAAPKQHQSGKSSAITVGVPITTRLLRDEPRLKAYAIDGTPVDCVKLALSRLLPTRPTVVLTGINHGYNSGMNTIYSGTMGAAFEAVIHRVPAVAFSYGDYDPQCDMSTCRPVIKHVLERVLPAIERGSYSPELCLNVNVPPAAAGELHGIKVTKADTGRWVHEFVEQTDPYGRTIYWTTGEYNVADATDIDTDSYWLGQGYATVVPCQVDQTATAALGLVERMMD